MDRTLLKGILDQLTKLKAGGITRIARIAPTVSTSAYSAGDSIGGSIEVVNAFRGAAEFSGIIKSISLMYEDAVAAGDVTVHFFTDDPGAVDNSAFDPSDAVMATKVPGNIVLTTTDNLEEFDARDILETDTCNLPYSVDITNSKKLYMVIVADAAVTFTATDEFFVNVGLLLD